MTRTTHRLGGILAGIAVIEQLSISFADWGSVLAGAVLGSLLPDIDKADTLISKRMPIVSAVVNICQKILRVLSRLFPKKISRKIRSMAGHRGIFHSLLLPGILAVPLLAGGAGAGGGFPMGCLVGIFSHLILDMFSGGVPLLMPLYMKRITLAGFNTGGMVEHIIRVAIVVLIIGRIQGVFV